MLLRSACGYGKIIYGTTVRNGRKIKGERLKMRKFIDLNFDWKFSERFAEDMLKASYDDSAFESVDIPHTVKELPYNYFDEKTYQFVSCYRKRFRLPAEAFADGRRIFVNFAGAANYAVV